MTKQKELLQELRLANRSDPFVPYQILRTHGKPISIGWRFAVAMLPDKLYVYPKAGANIQVPIEEFTGLKRRAKRKGHDKL